MYDALMLASIVDELNDRLLDGKVQRVLLLDTLSIGLEVYSSGARHQLLISADASNTRLHLVGGGDGAGRLTGDAARVTPLLLLLRKWVRGARLVRIYQESPLERVAFLRFAKFIPFNQTHAEPEPTDDAVIDDDDDALDGELVETTLAVEIMGRHSNLILVGPDGAIMDSAKRVPTRLSRVRQILPKLPYEAVPPQEKADPRTVTVGALSAALGANPGAQVHTILVGALRGVSPQTAREVAFRATGSIRTKAADALDAVPAIRQALDEILAPLRTGAWSPTLYLRAPEVTADEEAAVGGGEIPVAFSPFPLFHLRAMREEQIASPSALVERYFGTTAKVQAHGQRKDALAATINGERERLLGRQRALETEAKRAEEAERWRRWGEAIYAYAWSLEPGQRELVADDLTVPLDPSRTPSENAQDYFERYRKAQSAAANLPALLAEVGNGIAYLDQILALLRHAERYEQIAAIDREWQDWRAGRQKPQGGDDVRAGQGKRRGGKGGMPKGRGPGPGKPQTLRARGGHQIYIGHTSAQNDAVTFDIAGPDDSWLHSRGVPGSHVIVKWAGGRKDDTIVQAAAELAAYYSGGRESGRVEVDHAARRDVRKIRGAGPGMVTYRNEHTVRVVPRGEEELRKIGLVE
jgi:predicted ribosome quality control (RQC) complex YloA/Tae2 family protein